MMHSILLAYRYICYHRLRTLLMMAALTLTMMLPVATRWTIERFRTQAMQRAESTPLVVGAKGSSFGLTLHALYFRGETPPTIAYDQRERLDTLQFGVAVPILARFRAQGHAVVGTSNDYFAFRKLNLAEGDPLERWGDCLIGWQTAKELNLKTGDTLLSDPEKLFDLSGAAPLRMRVRGVLARTGSADDEVIFCHLETAWIMAGIGHGHRLAAANPDPTELTVESKESGSEHEHGAENLQRYSEVTAESLASFHFHGKPSDYPLTAIIVLPKSEREATLLEGKFLGDEEKCQVVVPRQIVSDLLQQVARIGKLLDAVSLLMAASTLVLVGLVMSLSWRMRSRELNTLKLLGASRWQIIQIVACELGLITLMSGLIALALAAAIVYNWNPIFAQFSNLAIEAHFP